MQWFPWALEVLNGSSKCIRVPSYNHTLWLQICTKSIKLTEPVGSWLMVGWGKRCKKQPEHT